ncbi:MAG: NADH-quinone oxidoreductase subunit NuoF [Armatimonadetes bacterium]|nr:NADH-quinone oxidoreductase subunit NuoF [Armatimonadota bacterium]
MERVLTQNIRPSEEPLTLLEYEQCGGYQGLRKALWSSPEEIQQMVTEAGLLGRGGAGFPTGRKWGSVPMGDRARHPKYFVVNADEMEPGAMKDRLLLEGDPHQLIEGIIISSYAIEASQAYIFLRWEYQLAARRLISALSQAYHNNRLGANILGSPYSLDIHLHQSGGRYMCGEAEALLSALEGRRAVPRSKPPYPTVCGLWGKPTVVNNVETVCNVPHIVKHGPEWFRSLSHTDEGGTKIYGASGRVRQPGLWELPMGTTIREVLEEHAGGMHNGHALKALLPGGGSTAFVLPEQLDTRMDFASMEAIGSRLGTGTMTVMDERTCPVGLVWGLEQFFARESCGWCTPCREGLPWVARTLEALETGDGRPGDLETLEHHVRWVRMGNTFCALAPGAMMPLESALRHFRSEFEDHVAAGGCPRR